MEMPFELVTVEHSNGSLHGLWSHTANSKGVAVHVHGTWGNFYGNALIARTARLYASHGLDFVTVNFPGHDETAIDENIDDFAPALDRWLALVGSSHTPVLLQGHSLGAVKIADAIVSDRLPRSVVGVVMLAPFDVVAFYSRATEGNIEKLHQELERASDDDHGLVPTRLFDSWLISTRAMRNLTTPGGRWDQFPTRNGDPGAALSRTTVPIITLIGGDDFAATPSPPDAVSILTGPQSRSIGSVVPGAPHNFAGRETELVSAIDDWLKTAEIRW